MPILKEKVVKDFVGTMLTQLQQLCASKGHAITTELQLLIKNARRSIPDLLVPQFRDVLLLVLDVQATQDPAHSFMVTIACVPNSQHQMDPVNHHSTLELGLVHKKSVLKHRTPSTLMSCAKSIIQPA